MNHMTMAGLIGALGLLAQSTPADEFARFSATVSGEGPDVIFIPGLASSGDVWDATAERLAPSYRVHVLEIAGFAGLSGSINAGEPVLAPLVEDIAAYASSLDRPALIGHSMGGLVALQIAADHPKAVGRLMVVDALPFYALILNPPATVETVRPQAAMIRDQLVALSAEAYERYESAAVSNLVKSEDGRARVLEWALMSDRRVVAAALYEDMITDARPVLAMIEVPATVVYAYDPAMGRPAAMIDELYSSAYSGLDGARLIRLEESYHFVMLDRPDAFAREVENFLR